MTETVPERTPEPVLTPDIVTLNRTDVGNGERLIARHGRDLRYVHVWQRWLVWDGCRWADDTSGEAVRRAKETLRFLAANANEVADDKDRRALLKFALESERDARVRAALAMAQSEAGVPVQPADLDADPWLLNVANGTVDLRTGELFDHDRVDRLTKLAPVAYSPDAACRVWEQALETWLGGDRDTIEYVRRFAGYSLTGSTREQVLPIVYGPGENGKSTFLTTMLQVAGDYGQQTPTSTFLDRREGIPNDVARLRGARLVVAAETGENRRLNEALVKQMTGGDRISARFMRSEFFEFTPQFKPWLATNHMPEIRGTDHAIWRRIRLIPFTATIPAGQRDPDLADKLAQELPGILAWAIQGCLDWQQHGLVTPAAVTSATSDYRNTMDVVGRFLDDHCTLHDGARTRSSELYQRYLYWAKDAGEEDPLSAKAFGQRLQERGLRQHRSNNARAWLGIAINRNDENGGNP